MRAASVLVVVSCTFVSQLAHADAKSCIDASEKGQSLRNEGKLVGAKAALAQCAADACPAAIRKECASELAAVDDAIPTVVFGAKVDGRDVAAVSVKIDGALVVDTIDGRAVALDPGPHVFRFEASGRPPVEQSLILKQGEKNRSVEGTWSTGSGAEAAPFGAERLATVDVGGKTDDATPVLQVRRSGRWFDACTAPCGKQLSLDSTYRITGAGVPKSAPFMLEGRPGEKLAVAIREGDDGGTKTAAIVALTGAGALVLGGVFFVIGLAVGTQTYAPTGARCDDGTTPGTTGCHSYGAFYGLAATAGILGGTGLITGVVGLIMLAAGRAAVTQSSVAARLGPSGIAF